MNSIGVSYILVCVNLFHICANKNLYKQNKCQCFTAQQLRFLFQRPSLDLELTPVVLTPRSRKRRKQLAFADAETQISKQKMSENMTNSWSTCEPLVSKMLTRNRNPNNKSLEILSHDCERYFCSTRYALELIIFWMLLCIVQVEKLCFSVEHVHPKGAQN